MVALVFVAAKSSKEKLDFWQLRLDPLSFTEDYFAVYNGAVILTINPYINHARTLGLSSVVTGGYTPKGNANISALTSTLCRRPCALFALIRWLHRFFCPGFGIRCKASTVFKLAATANFAPELSSVHYVRHAHACFGLFGRRHRRHRRHLCEPEGDRSAQVEAADDDQQRRSKN